MNSVCALQAGLVRAFTAVREFKKLKKICMMGVKDCFPELSAILV